MLSALDLDSVITHVFALDDIGAAMDCAIQDKGGKVLLAPNGE